MLSNLIQCLEKVGIDPVLAKFLQREFLGQVVVRQLLDTIKGLQLELECSKRTMTTLSTHITTTACK